MEDEPQSISDDLIDELVATATSNIRPVAIYPEWQPIETAPATGPILIIDMKARMPHVFYAGIRSSRAGWWETTKHVAVEPTHWMPLPAAPSPTAD